MEINMKNTLTILILFLFLNGCTKLIELKNNPNQDEIIYEAKKSVILTYSHSHNIEDYEDFKKEDLKHYEFSKIALFKSDEKPNNIYVCGRISAGVSSGGIKYPLETYKYIKNKKKFIKHLFIYLHGRGSCITGFADRVESMEDTKCDGRYYTSEVDLRKEKNGCPIF
jgi:coenzyme F420-reducing hydrogenase alpha subunit